MNTKDIRILKLLEAVGNEKPTSQRAIAKQLDVSLGLVNGFLQKLTCDGFCSISSSLPNKKKYALTPEGKAEKSRLTYDYILLSYKLFREAQAKLIKFFNRLETHDLKRVVFYGINDFAEIAYLSVQKTSVNIVTVVDEEKAGEYFFDLRIEDPAVLSDYAFDKILITANNAHAQRTAENLENYGFKGKVSILL